MPDYVAKFEKAIDRRIDRAISQMRKSGLAQSSIENGGVDEVDADGNLMSRVGAQFDDTHAPVTFSGPIPPIPAGVSVAAGLGSIKVAWDGTFIDALVAPLDWTAFEVHASPDPDFIPDPLPDSSTRVGIIGQPAGGSLTFQPATGSVYVRCVTRTAAGKYSDPTIAVDAYAVPAAASVNQDGGGVFTSLSVQADPIVLGVPLLGQLSNPAGPSGWADTLSWGCVSRADFTSLVNNITIAPGGSVTQIGQFSVPLNPNRSYQLVMHWRGYAALTPGAYSNVTTRFYVTNATDPNGEAPDPTTSSTVIGQQSENFANSATGLDDQLVINFITGDPSAGKGAVQYKFMLGIFANGNAFTPDIVNVPTQDNWVVTIFDTGRVPLPAPVTAPGTGTKRTYISTWRADNSRSWADDSTVYNPTGGSTTSNIRQGVAGGHQWFGAFSCGSNGIAGETTKTIAQALTGGAVIQKAEVWVQITWSGEDVGQVELRPLGANAVPSTMSTPPTSSNITKHDYPSRNTGAWITVPTSWFTTTNNGCIIASPDWLFNNTNCQFAGAGYSTVAARPMVRLTYTR